MTIEEAVKIVNSHPILISQLMELLPEEWENEDNVIVNNFLIEFAQASLEV